MSDPVLAAMRDLIQEDVGGRGLRADPAANLVTAFPEDFAAACRNLAETPNAAVGIVTGFFIPHAEPPGGETDGPLGALFLARALVPLGARVVLITDGFCRKALEAGLAVCGLRESVQIVILPGDEHHAGAPASSWLEVREQIGPLTHLIALERVGPSHTPESLGSHPGTTDADLDEFLGEVPPKRHDRCHTMKGLDITAQMSPAHRLFEAGAWPVAPPVTIGIGDGGNEIGMGKIPWRVIRRNIPGGGLVACRVPTDLLIVCGVSNWGAYGLAAGVLALRAQEPDLELFEPERERELLGTMVEQGPLVDGVTGKPTVSVDGLSFESYIEPLTRLGALVRT